MSEDRNQNQIIRIDARGCFVESLSDAFEIGKAHLTFASYDMNRPSGQRQTNSIQVYIDAAELLELCRKLTGGEMRYLVQNKKKTGDKTPIYQCLGGTSADKLARYGRPRADGMSLSRTAQLVCGNKTDFLFVADSGPGEADSKGLIVPRFGKNPENHVSVSMTFESFSELMLMTKTHYEAWLAARYYSRLGLGSERAQPQPKSNGSTESTEDETRMF
jgi:hypothetical protein